MVGKRLSLQFLIRLIKVDVLLGDPKEQHENKMRFGYAATLWSLRVYYVVVSLIVD